MNKEDIMINMSNIKKIYDTGKVKVEALKNINLKINKNEQFAIIGPSGSGKSTLMHIMGCLDKPTEGNYYLNNKNINNIDIDELSYIRNKEIGFVFQNFFLLPYLTAFENVELPMIFAGKKKKERKERVDFLLNLVGMYDRRGHKPNELSGGQQQRIAIARALANDPELILADEPTGNLDQKSGIEIIKIFLKLWEHGKTIGIITHDMNLANQFSRQIKIVDGNIVYDNKN